jgi:hypothetical protein
MKSTQSDKGLGFDGAEIVAARKPSQSVKKNQWSGHSNDGRLVQMGQQPNRKGNDGSCHHSGMAQGGKSPQVAALKGRPANPDAFNAGAQVRGAGGVMPKSPANPDRINSGRGPTKGNKQ